MSELRVMPETVEIEPLPFDRAKKLRNGKKVAITADVGDFACRLRDIHESLRLFYSPEAGAYVVEQHTPQGDGSVVESLVTVSEDLDERLLNRVRKVCAPGYDLEAEIARSEASAAAAHDAGINEKLGDAAEKMAFALKKDLGRHEIGKTLKSRAFIPPRFDPSEAA